MRLAELLLVFENWRSGKWIRCAMCPYEKLSPASRQSKSKKVWLRAVFTCLRRFLHSGRDNVLLAFRGPRLHEYPCTSTF